MFSISLKLKLKIIKYLSRLLFQIYLTIIVLTEAGYAGVGYSGLGHAGLEPAGFGHTGPYAGVRGYVASAPISAPIAPVVPVAPGFSGHGLDYSALVAGKTAGAPLGSGHDVDYYVSSLLSRSKSIYIALVLLYLALQVKEKILRQ